MSGMDHDRRPEPEPRGDAQEHARSLSLLLVDDEDRFRTSLATRLARRGYDVDDVGDGEEAIRRVRQRRPDVVLLDRRMPVMDGEDVLKAIKRIAPEVQVIMLTGHASLDSAAKTGRLEAFAYLEKPCELDELIGNIEAAGREKGYAMARLEIPHVESRSVWGWLWGTQNFRPGIMILGALIFSGIVLSPSSERLLSLVSATKTGKPSEPIAGYAGYRKMKPGETIALRYSQESRRMVKTKGPRGQKVTRPLSAERTAQAAKVMIGILAVAALFWATGAMPIGITALLVGLLMYLFGVFPPDLVTKAYAKDAVIFVMGVLALAVGIGKTGLDRRIGMLLLGSSKSLKAYLFIFLPLLAITASFLSEHALIAFLVPILMMVYMGTAKLTGYTRDRSLAVLMLLSVCFAANIGGPGSPAAGGRNAVMIGILGDYGDAPSFGQWVMYGLPFVPVMALVIAAYFYLRFRRTIERSDLNVSQIVQDEARKLGKMTQAEYLAAGILVVVIALWITMSDTLGMGGPVLLGIVAMAALKIVTWRDINRISWDVVALYASACAIGVGLSSTGASLWIASGFVELLPGFLRTGEGLSVASSLLTGLLTNIMSDGATVSAVGPITVPMASVAGSHPWMVGLATAFASSFAHCLIIGTPNNAIAYSLAKDSETGEQLLTMGDFLKHGLVVTLLSFAVLWGWVIFGYWRWIGFQ
jgi:sodium-dependent dicarboxylate transporter 2/3/5